ncbi:hypothetical protein QTG56_25975 (plasmid) [Rossellomorea sp. AcN35-11]|nr:hypothetical protein [Rossellomorea aquimaris]WJV32066.1 hypothetical protein QTG56_25975 [Rossellomorea sp. AcN35-11]
MRGKVLDAFLTVEEYLEKKIRNVSDLEIAMLLGYSEETLRRWKRLNQITNYQIAKFRYDRIIQFQGEGKSLESIRTLMKMHPKTIKNIVKKFS